MEGVVKLKMLAAASYVPGIPVSLDGGQTEFTGPDGHYYFKSIPEGPHEVALALAQLPADFDPGEAQKSQVLIQPRRPSRADFEVLPLVTIQGRLHGPEQAPLEDIVIRLAPGSRYTTTNKQGVFTLYNVREGDFELALDPKTLTARMARCRLPKSAGRDRLPVPPRGARRLRVPTALSNRAPPRTSCWDGSGRESSRVR